jgi:hypothetical protein
LHHKLLYQQLSINVIEKFHFGNIPAHVDSVRMGDFRELLFGTVLEGAASAERRRRLRRTGSVEVERWSETFSPVFLK